MAFIRPEDQLKQMLIFHPKKVGKSGGVAPTPPSYDSDAQAFFTAVEGGGDSLTTTEKDATNQLVLDLKAASLFNVFDAFYPFVGGTATAHKWNLLDPQDTDAAYRMTFLGGMTHSSTGIRGNGTNSVGNTHWNIVSRSATQTCVGLYINDGLTATPNREYDFGAFVTTPTTHDGGLVLGYQDKTTKYVNFQGTSFFSTTLGDYTSGMLLGQNNGTTTQLYQDDTQLISSAETLGSIDYEWGVGASFRDVGGTPTAVSPSQRGYGTAFIGDTYLNQTQITALNTALVTFNTSLSRN